MATNLDSTTRRVLHSWKEISSYTGRGVRTIQRYEVQFGFPVHRPAGSPRSAVLAFTDEIDRWLAGSPTRVLQPVVSQNGILKDGPLQDGAAQNVHTARLHAMYMQAKLGCDRARSMHEQLVATQELLHRLTDSMARFERGARSSAQHLKSARNSSPPAQHSSSV